MNKKHTFKVGKYISMACLLFVCATVQSCRDEYYYDDREPEWLGESIYEYLESEGNFKYFMKVIEDLNYKEVLSKTGSKTLFVADDEAFIEGVKKEWKYEGTDEEVYKQLTLAQKRLILNNSMLDNAYLLELMSSMPSSNANSEPVIGRCLRQATSAAVTDTIGLFYDADIPQNNEHWDEFRQSGIRLALDGTKSYMVHFLEEQLYQNQISLDDVKCLLNYPDYSITSKDAFIFDKKVIDQNVTCKNGYVHQLDGLLIPPSNMAEEIRTNGQTSIFSRMLDRFAVPVPNTTIMADYNRIHHYLDDANAEYVYEKRYWTAKSNRGSTGDFLKYTDYHEVEHIAKDGAALYFDPGWNAYKPGESSTSQPENDMAVIFAPSDSALTEYFTLGAGKALIERYGRNVPDPFGAGLVQATDSIPLKDLQHLMRNMMKNSFNSAVPSRFESIMNDARDPMGVEKSHLEKCIIANNGVIYVTNAVYSPARYVAVIAPVMLSDTLKISNWGINKYEYDKYLLSMGSTFSLTVPSDGCMKYLDPYSLKAGQTPTMYVFKWDNTVTDNNKAVYAETWECDPITLDTLKQKDNITTNKNSALIENLLKQMFEYYIVVGDFNEVPSEYAGMMPNKYHMTKGYGTVKVEHEETGEAWPNQYKVTSIAGGYQVQHGESVPVGETYYQENGNTYRLDAGMIQPSTQSVYKVLSDSVNHPEFANFYDLCVGSDLVLETIVPADSLSRYQIFTSNLGSGITCMDMNVSTFNTYHYTVYVPTNENIDEAYNRGLPSWIDLEDLAMDIQERMIVVAEKEQELDDMDESIPQDVKDALQAEIDTLNRYINIDKASLRTDVELIVAFVKYHFQDNSVYVDNLPHYIIEGETKKTVVDYETSTLDEITKRFCTLRVETQDHTYGPTISVKGDITGMDNTCCVVNAPGTEGQLYNIMTRDIEFSSSKTINTSSFAVVHQIDAMNDGLGFLVNDRIYDATTGTFIK